MKLTKTLLLSFFAVLLLTFSSFGQKQPSNNSKSKTKSSQTKSPEGWKLVDLNSFSFILPESMKDKKARGIDSAFWKFSNGEMELHVDSGMYRVSFEYDSTSYETKTGWLELDGIKGQFFKIDFTKPNFSEEDEDLDDDIEYYKERPFLTAIVFYRGKNLYSSFWIRSKNREQNELADKILQSIKFKK